MSPYLHKRLRTYEEALEASLSRYIDRPAWQVLADELERIQAEKAADDNARMLAGLIAKAAK